MKLIVYLNINCRFSNDIRAILNKYNLSYEEHDVAGASESNVEITQGLGQKPFNRVEIDDSVLVNTSGKVVENYLLEKGLVEPVDRKSKRTLFTDEEQEVTRSKTTRFF